MYMYTRIKPLLSDTYSVYNVQTSIILCQRTKRHLMMYYMYMYHIYCMWCARIDFNIEPKQAVTLVSTNTPQWGHGGDNSWVV